MKKIPVIILVFAALFGARVSANEYYDEYEDYGYYDYYDDYADYPVYEIFIDVDGLTEDLLEDILGDTVDLFYYEDMAENI